MPGGYPTVEQLGQCVQRMLGCCLRISCLAALLSNAWKQRSRPVSGKTMLRAFHDSCSVGRNLTSSNSAAACDLDFNSSKLSACRGLPALPCAILCLVGRVT